MEELDLDAAIEAGERALALSDGNPAPVESALARAMLALALNQAGDDQRAAKLAQEARRASESAYPGTAAIVRVAGAMGAVGAGELSEQQPTWLRTPCATPRRSTISSACSPAMMLEAWIAEQRDDEEAATAAYRRVLEPRGPTALCRPRCVRLGGARLARAGKRKLRGDAEELLKRALAAADAARAPWVTAYARVELGRARAAAGDADTAEKLYRQALDPGQRNRGRTGPVRASSS